jgi:Putative zinc ribbon domain
MAETARSYKDCQSCGMPMRRDEKGGGTNADGSKNLMYCSHCYEAGTFTLPHISASEMRSECKESFARLIFPALPRGSCRARSQGLHDGTRDNAEPPGSRKACARGRLPRPRLLAYFKEQERPNPRPLDLQGVATEVLSPKCNERSSRKWPMLHKSILFWLELLYNLRRSQPSCGRRMLTGIRGVYPEMRCGAQSESTSSTGRNVR